MYLLNVVENPPHVRTVATSNNENIVISKYPVVSKLSGKLITRWTFQHQLYELKAASGATPPCILVKF
jgi:hypothetical protein